MEPLTPQKKRAKRIQKSFVARFRIHNEGDESYFDDSSKWNIVTIKNLSSSGIFFNYNEKIPVDTELELNISLPFISEPVHCLGKVCRVDEDKKYQAGLRKIPVYGIAVFFEIIDDNIKNAIDDFAENFCQNG
ncbi:MAG: PilZ domain-containing protein [bacterium]